MELKSKEFTNNGDIPSKYTCQGVNISPPLTFSGVPETTVSLALLMDDPDAPDPKAPKMVWDHWVVWNIPPEISEVPEDWFPDKAIEGFNSWGNAEYGGPCPPKGKHRYFFRLYALDKQLELPPEADKKDVLEAMEGHIIDQAELIGLYEKQ